MQSFDDVLLFSIKSKILKITKKDNSFGIYLSLSYDPAILTPLVCVHSHPCFLEGVRVHHPSSVVATSLL